MRVTYVLTYKLVEYLTVLILFWYYVRKFYGGIIQIHSHAVSNNNSTGHQAVTIRERFQILSISLSWDTYG